MTQAKHPAGKAIAGFIGAAVVAVAAAGGAYAYTTQYAYVAIVNGSKLPMGVYQRRLDGLKRQYQQQMGVNFHSESGKEVLRDVQAKVMDRLVEAQLIRLEAAKRGIAVDEATVDKELDEIVQTNFDGDRSKLDARLQQMAMTVSDVREQIADGHLTRTLMDQIAGSDAVSEAQALAFYNENKTAFEREAEVKAAHILVASEAEANTIHGQLRQGVPFADLAKKHSTDPGSAANGGDLGFFGRGRMVKEFEEAAFALKVGEISRPVKSQFGYHIIKLLDRHAGGLLPFASVKAEIIEQQGKQRQQEAFRKWLDAAKKDAAIAYASGYAPSSDAQDRPASHDGHNH